MSGEQHPKVIQVLMLTRIVWSIMVLFQMLLLMLSFVLWIKDHPGEDFLVLPYWDMDIVSQPLGMALVVFAIGNGFGALALPQIAAKFSSMMTSVKPALTEDDVAKVRKAFTFYILHLACLEMCAVCGFAYGFLFKNPMLTLPFILGSLFLSLLAFPTVGKLKGLGS